jgi:membrane-associated protease RseP (regulator of RpoE activity)
MLWVLGAVLFLFGLLLSIALHELGHLMPARAFGVMVTEWMVGFGPTAWSKRRGDTEFGIKWIPVGGYIRMVGMLPPAADVPPGKVRRASTGPIRSLVENAREAAWEDVEPGDEHRLFYRKAWWQRVIIMAGGPAMNIVLAIALISVALIGIGVSTAQPIVEGVQDCVLPVSAGRTVCQDGDPATPALTAGLRHGDRIVSFDGAPIDSWTQLTTKVRAAAERPVTVGVERAGQQISVHLTPVVAERYAPDDPDVIESVGFLGIRPALVRERQSPGKVATLVGAVSKDITRGMVNLPQRMVGVWHAAFSDEPRDVRSPMGVVGATRLGGEVAAAPAPVADRIVVFLHLLATFNLAMGLFNLLPLLPLDGGHIAAAVWEGLRRRVARLFGRRYHGHVDVARTLPITYAVAILLMAMAALLAYADIVNPVRLGG